MKLKSDLLFNYGSRTCDLRLFAHSPPLNFLDCLGLIDVLSMNERAEIIACILLVYQLLGTSKVWKARK